MKHISEIMDEMSELRQKAKSVSRDSDAMWNQVKFRGHEIRTDILDYWMSNGGLDGKYFKAPYYCQDWETMDLPASRCYCQFVRIDRFLFTDNAAIRYCGRTFKLGDGLKVDCSFNDRPNQIIRISKLHPDNLITKEEFEKAEAEYQRRFDNYVKGLVGGTSTDDDSSNELKCWDGSSVKCAYNGTRGLLCD